jgi:iron complex outermembrane receptor protein
MKISHFLKLDTQSLSRFCVLAIILFSYHNIFANNQAPSHSNHKASSDSLKKDTIRNFINPTGVLVVSHRENELELDINKSIEENLRNISGISFIDRGAFASEPTFRGLSASRLSMTLDGMKIQSACTDRMDPISSYIEPEMISSINYNSNTCHSATACENLDFGLNSINFVDKLSVNYSTDYYSNSNYWKNAISALYSNKKYFVTGSFSNRKSSDYYAGDSKLINLSSFEKSNLYLHSGMKISDNFDSKVTLIYDHTLFAEFPALIMDADDAKTFVFSWDNHFEKISDYMSNFNIKVYGNSVKHLMTDYKRSDLEINNRVIMPGMYMPMLGKTSTIGMIASTNLNLTDKPIWLSLQSNFTKAFADMNMEPLDSLTKSMYLMNIGNSMQFSNSLALQQMLNLSDNLYLHWNFVVGFDQFTLETIDARKTLKIYNPNAKDDDFQDKTSMPLSFRVSFKNIFNSNNILDFSLAFKQRSANHIERFGYFLYNPSDNSIYIGNPKLNLENMYTSELSYFWQIEKLKLKSTVFLYYWDDYIAGRLIALSDSSNKLFPQAIKQYDGIGQAYSTGFEFNINWDLDPLLINAKVNYLYSQASSVSNVLTTNTQQTYNDALPLQAPMNFDLDLIYNIDKIHLFANIHAEAEQNHYSTILSKESRTPAFVIANIGVNSTIFEFLDAKLELTNIFDKYYYRHTSISYLASEGRSVRVGIRLKY